MRAARAVAPDSASERSGRFALTRPESLRQAAEFAAVFAAKRSSRGKHLVVSVRPCGRAGARLGLAVSRRASRLAVRRNYMKRVLRELFARRVSAFAGLDVVVAVAAQFDRPDFETVRAEFERHTETIQKWRVSSSG
jgi:ribonuclease P protein component